jgi:hypothetical protein
MAIPAIWLAELLRAQAHLAPDAEARREIAALLGLAGGGVSAHPAQSAEAAAFAVAEDTTAAADQPESRPVTPVPERRPDEEGEWTRLLSTIERIAEAQTAGPPPWLTSIEPLTVQASPPPRPPRPLLGQVQRRSILGLALAVEVPEGPLDVARAVRILAAGRPLLRLPRRPRRSLRYGLEVLVDRAPWLEPWFLEQTQTVAYLRSLFPIGRLRVKQCRGSPAERKPRLPRLRRGLVAPEDPRSPVLALSDLGSAYRHLGDPPPDPRAWVRHGRALGQAGRPFLALVPSEHARWRPPLGSPIPALAWSERTTVRDAVRLRNGQTAGEIAAPAADAEGREAEVWSLARVLSPALRIDPWLLREARLTLLPHLDVGVEADLWFSPLVSSRSPEGLVLQAEALARLRQELREDPALLAPALALVRAAHPAYPETIRLEEALVALEMEDSLGEADVEALLRPALKTLAGGGQAAEEIARWAAHAWVRFSPAVREANAARQLVYAAYALLSQHQAAGADLPRDMAWLLPQASGRSLGVEWRRYADDSLELVFTETTQPTNALHALAVPDTRPAWIEITEENGSDPTVLACEPGTRYSVGANTRALRLRTLASDEYRLQVSVSWRDGVGASLLRISPDSPAAARTALMIDGNLAVTAGPGLVPGQVIELTSGTQRIAWVARVLGSFGSDAGSDVSVLKLLPSWSEGTGKAPWRPFDPAARLLADETAAAGPARRIVLHAARTQAGVTVQAEWDAVLRTHESHLLGGLVRDEGGLMRDARGGWELIVDVADDPRPTSFKAPRKRQAPIVTAPLFDVVAGARTLARSRWSCELLTSQEDEADAGRIRGALANLVDPWRFTDRLEECEMVLWVGARADSGVLATLAAAAQAGQAVLWVPLNPNPNAVLRRLPLSLQSQLSQHEWFGLGEKLPLDDRSTHRIAEQIAAWELPAEDATTQPAQAERPGLLAQAGASLKQRLVRALDANPHANGLYRVALDAPFALQAFEFPRSGEPILLLIHGDVSTGESNFGDLWAPAAQAERMRLHERYRDRVLSFEHFSVKEGPIESALNLVQALPSGSRLHILSLSAGGLIGELLARGQRADGRPPFDEIDDSFLAGATAEEDRKRLQLLSRLLQQKRLEIARFVRVACPARGMRFYSDAPEQALSLLNVVAAGLSRVALKPLGRLFTDPRFMPGLAMLAPDSPLIHLLNRPDVEVLAPLTVVTGISRKRRLIGGMGLQLAHMLHGDEDHDVVVTLASALGGTPRKGIASRFVEASEEVDHFSYFKNAATRRAAVDALLAASDPPLGFQPLQTGGEGMAAP